ncbi:MAG: NAD(P)H-binding protein [Myxococcota bacterium]
MRLAVVGDRAHGIAAGRRGAGARAHRASADPSGARGRRPRPGLRWVEGDVLDPSSVAQLASAGVDAMVVALGPDADSPPDLCKRGTAAVISACRAFRIRRLVVITGAMIGHPRERMAMLLRTMWRTYSVVRGAHAADREAQEQLVMESGLDWTLDAPAAAHRGRPHRGGHGRQRAVRRRARAGDDRRRGRRDPRRDRARHVGAQRRDQCSPTPRRRPTPTSPRAVRHGRAHPGRGRVGLRRRGPRRARARGARGGGPRRARGSPREGDDWDLGEADGDERSAGGAGGGRR